MIVLSQNLNTTNHGPTAAAPKPPPPPSLHRDDDDETVKQLQECSSLFLSLQDCLVNSDRNWKSCQKEVQALMACNERRRKQ